MNMYWGNLKITKINTTTELDNWLKQNLTKAYAVDIETTSLNVLDAKIESIQLYNGINACYIEWKEHEDGMFIILNNLFQSKRILVGHNISFDIKILKRRGFKFDCEFYDTMTAQHLLNETTPLFELGLKKLAQTILHKSEVMSWEDARGHGLQSDEWLTYCINDVLWTWELMEYQKPLLVEQGLMKLFREIEMPFVLCLVDMETNGFLIDSDMVKLTTLDFRNKKEILETNMLDTLDIKYDYQIDLTGKGHVISDLNFNSSQQLGKILFETLGLPIIETTPAGKPSVGKLTIEKLKDKHEFVQLLSDYKYVSKMLSGFLEPMPEHIDKDGRIRASFNNSGTATGRLSCNKPNLQQLNKEIKKVFIAPRGKRIINIDFKAQEVRVMAHLSQDPTLIKAINDGKDLHLTTANEMFNLGINEKDLYESSVDYEKFKKQFSKERYNAKSILFGLCYGKSAYGFSKDFNTTEEEAQVMVDKFFNTYPKLKEAIDSTHKEIKQRGYVTSIVGRRRRFKKESRQGEYGTYECYPSHAYRQSFNFLIQGASADMIRLAMIKVRKEVPEAELLATVHDSSIYEVDNSGAEEIAQKINKCFETCMELSVPIGADWGIGETYYDAS